jgi:hypothetical protein
VFGPVAAVIRAASENDALRIANETRFGLGSSIWSKDAARAEQLAARIEAGCTFVNGMVKSDPRLPFGGVKAGHGRAIAGDAWNCECEDGGSVNASSQYRLSLKLTFCWKHCCYVMSNATIAPHI